jgi:hypothetical protein
MLHAPLQHVQLMAERHVLEHDIPMFATGCGNRPPDQQHELEHTGKLLWQRLREINASAGDPILADDTFFGVGSPQCSSVLNTSHWTGGVASVTLTSTSIPRNEDASPMKVPHKGRACR